MELAASLFEDITGCDVQSLDPVKPGDRRRACRVPLLSRAAVYPAENGFGHSSVVLVNDVSASGVGFLHRERVRPRQQFILQMPRRGAPSVMLLCIVERCDPAGEKFFVGASFAKILSAEDATEPATSQSRGQRAYSHAGAD